jgi:ribosomal protein L7/L12
MSSGQGGGAGTGGAPEAAQEKLTFDIKIGAVDQKAKIKIIKEVRGITGLGLKEVGSFHSYESEATLTCMMYRRRKS